MNLNRRIADPVIVGLGCLVLAYGSSLLGGRAKEYVRKHGLPEHVITLVKDDQRTVLITPNYFSKHDLHICEGSTCFPFDYKTRSYTNKNGETKFLPITEQHVQMILAQVKDNYAAKR